MAENKAAPKVEDKAEAEAKTEKKEEKKLVVRLLADYWDADGVRRSASWIDESGEARETGALIELPAAEARALVKSGAGERGDEY